MASVLTNLLGFANTLDNVPLSVSLNTHLPCHTVAFVGTPTQTFGQHRRIYAYRSNALISSTGQAKQSNAIGMAFQPLNDSTPAVLMPIYTPPNPYRIM